MKSIRFKMLAAILSLTGAILTVFTVVIVEQSGRMLSVYAYEIGLRTAEANAGTVENALSSLAEICRSVAKTVETLKQNGMTERAFLPEYFHAIMESRTDVFAIWSMFEPDAWDGQDRRYAGTDGYDETGSFWPWVYRDSGELMTQVESWGEAEYQAEYYRLPAETESIVMLEPYLEEMDEDSDTTMSSVAMPLYDRTGRFFGVTGIDLSLDSLQKLVEEIEVFSNGYGMILSPGGMYVAAGKPDLVGKQIRETDTQESVALFMKTIHSDNSSTLLIDGGSQNGSVYRIYTPITINGISEHWVFAVDIPHSELTSMTRIIRAWLIGFAFSLGAVLAILVTILSGGLTRSIVRLTGSFSLIAQGDFTVKARVGSKDELGRMAQGFNSFTESLTAMIRELKRSVESLSQVGEELSGRMERTADSAAHIADAVEGVNRRVAAQSTSVQESTSSIDEIVQTIGSLDTVIGRQAESVERSTETMEQMVENIDQVSRSVETQHERMKGLLAVTEAGRTTISEVVRQSLEIAEQSESMLEANRVISSIAASTNLLAMNAAIEAAHAGQYGAGFAVVADEIRKLAESSNAQSAGVKKNLQQLKNVISAVVASSETAARAFGTVLEEVRQVSALEESVKLAMSRQSAETERIRESFRVMSGVSEEVKTGAKEMREGGGAILSEMNRLVEMSREIAAEMERIDLGTEEIRRIVDEVSRIGQENRSHIRRVAEELNRFRIEESDETAR